MMPSADMTLRERVIAILQDKPLQWLRPIEIAALIKEHFPDYVQAKQQASQQVNVDPLLQIAREISAQRKGWIAKQPEIQHSDDSPRRYCWNPNPSLQDATGSPDSDTEAALSKTLKEVSLYPMLALYLANLDGHDLYPKRIRDATSSHTKGLQGNKYLHPDLVAMEDLMPAQAGWTPERRAWATRSGALRLKLWSFEVKKAITTVGDARTGYLQAVSNSAWAHYGYLVATAFSAPALDELKLLHELHGLGVILLSVENPIDDSVIKLPARQRSQLDWGICNRLACQNKDFQAFIELVADVQMLDKIKPTDWDIPPNPSIQDDSLSPSVT